MTALSKRLGVSGLDEACFRCERPLARARGVQRICRDCSSLPPVGVPPTPVRMPEPTTAMPGTLEKIRELRRRCWAGEELWHPMDSREGD